MRDLIVLSNRGPRSFRHGSDGALVEVAGGGGLVSALEPLLRAGAGGGAATWASVTMGAADREAVAAGRMVDEAITLLPVIVDDESYRQAYDVVANTTLWYLHHHLWDLPRRPRFDRSWYQAWEGFRRYNAAAADVLCETAAESATVLVQDYHFSLLGRLVARRRPDLRTAHFNHVPFADPNMVRVLPDFASAELLEGLGGFGACGFHTPRWEAAFRACYDAFGLPAPPTYTSALAPDTAGLVEDAATPACTAAADALRAEAGGRLLIVRSDRVEPSKNAVRGMLAYEELLHSHPEWRSKVVHVVLAYPSRQGLAEYLSLGSEVRHVAERINASLGTADWSPILLDIRDDRARSVAALTIADVLLVNPVRDGLNLVAMEGPVVNSADGVLVVSSEAGVWELFEQAGAAADGPLRVNPFDIVETAEALHRALSMPGDERSRRAARVRDVVGSRTALAWLDEQLAAARPPGP
ncbi:MAG TPA: trehalose-6-phosphate synthase [Acidimicrobiales bacterium]|nr:trehalose-6-phosphate synthase [Acidimicrobiales bacterium]